MKIPRDGRFKRVASLLLLTSCLSAALHAQPGEGANELETGTTEIGFWGGSAFGDAGKVNGQRLTVVAARWGVVFANTRNVAFQYTADFLPAVINFQKKSFSVDGQEGEFAGRTTTGWGVSPLGLKITANRRKLFQPFAEITAGVVRASGPIPVAQEGSTRWNFAWDVGGGAQWLTQGSRAFRIGFRHHRIKAAERLTTIPGLQSNIIYAGFSFLK